MTPSDAELRPEELPEREGMDRGTPERVPDPWGVKRAENLLTSLQGVLSARVEVSPLGEVTAVHVLTGSGIAAKQVVRNVESALLAQLGLKIDHRKISVAQTAEVRPIEALERSAVRDEARRRSVVYHDMEITSAGSRRIAVRVTLHVAGEEMSSAEEVADSPKGRLEGAAKAALSVLAKVVPTGTCELEGVKLTREFEIDLAMVAVRVLEGRNSELFIGTAEVEGYPERAAALAVLDATNRWFVSRT